MRFCIVLPVLALVVVECSHTFMGTSVFRQLVFYQYVKYRGNTLSKRIEYLNYTLPATIGYGRTIQGILAYDRTNSCSANVTAGGLGYPYVSLRMMSERWKDIRYSVYIYA
ncbi:uncharacterized protein LOC120632657 [Pararge aegeria]|uniref:Jg1956 protein n=1 Tax=Pararge aegeria aegeria TaxID=348720 RepID=A0A8S4R3D7_9NEOP|nr:uncharacterized protein LOC120632657 [Pararge aegeria]CAH2230454.1 jg1956 [Pararge aegeria aegeria]